MREYISKYPRIRGKLKDAETERDEIREHLTCRCPVPRNVQGLYNCEKGRDMVIKAGYWAGNVHGDNIPEPWEGDSEVKVWNRSDFVRNNETHKFAIVRCENGKCIHGSGIREWSLHGRSPCKSGLQMTGPLCGLCKPNTTLILASMVSDNAEL